MPYFPVDDQFSFHPKAVAAGNAALGLWVRAGSWCKCHASGGFVPEQIARAMSGKGDIRRLVDVGLWHEVLGGYYFHDWADQAGNDDGGVEKERRDAQREKDRIRKADQRAREAARKDAEGHADVTGTDRDSHGVTPPGVRGAPVPVPAPVRDIETDSSVPEVRSSGTDDDAEAEVERAKRAARHGVDYAKVKAKLSRQAGHIVEGAVVMQVVLSVIGRAKPAKGDRTGLILSAVVNDWAEWQQLIDQEAAA